MAEQTKNNQVVIDGTDMIAGRLASNVAKLLIQGKRVSIVNCENIMISGTRSNIIKEYRGLFGDFKHTKSKTRSVSSKEARYDNCKNDPRNASQEKTLRQDCAFQAEDTYRNAKRGKVT